jgi:DNA topoisomerase-3
MSKSLIIAEKPSVAADIARALGGFTRHDDHFESDSYVVSSAVGTCSRSDARGRGGQAGQVDLRAPSGDSVEIRAEADREERSAVRTLLRLIKRKDVVGALINACDAGPRRRVDLSLYRAVAKAAKPIRRLWLQSMTPAAIREGFERLRSDKEMQPLADAAVCRSEADWLVGINGTRAMTAFNSRSGGFQLTTVGRVKRPRSRFSSNVRSASAVFVRATTGKSRDISREAAANTPGAGSTRNGRRTTRTPICAPSGSGTRKRAHALVAKCTGQPGEVTEEAKPTTQGAPLLYDLTTLQREANSRFGFPRARRSRCARRSTRSTRCSRIRARIHARCRRITSAR